MYAVDESFCYKRSPLAVFYFAQFAIQPGILRAASFGLEKLMCQWRMTWCSSPPWTPRKALYCCSSSCCILRAASYEQEEGMRHWSMTWPLSPLQGLRMTTAKQEQTRCWALVSDTATHPMSSQVNSCTCACGHDYMVVTSLEPFHCPRLLRCKATVDIQSMRSQVYWYVCSLQVQLRLLAS